MENSTRPERASRAEFTLQSNRIAFLALSLGIAVASATVLKGATLTVTSLADSGSGTLRQTVANASANDTISIPLQGTITLTNGKIALTKNLRITGPATGQLKISGNKTTAVLSVQSNATVSLADLALINGSSRDAVSLTTGHTVGGGIQNFGNLTMTRCVVSGCEALDGAGGGIFSDNLLTLRQCSISNNTATLGGGVCDYSKGALVVDGCTFNGNHTSGPLGDDGGAIFKSTGNLEMTNSTISQNSSHDGVGGIATGGMAIFQSCTVVSNTSGLFVGGIGAASQVTCRDTIVARNLSQVLVRGWDISAAIISGGHNLIGDTNTSTITGITTGNLYGVNPLLGPLQNNGGVTLTHSLMPNSPAIDHGNAQGLTLDQRGYSRILDVTGVSNLGDGSDIGSLEVGASVPGTTPPPPTGGWTPLSLGSKLLVWVEPTNSYKDVAMTVKSTLNDTIRVLVNMGHGKFNFTNAETARKTAPYLNANRPGNHPTLFFEGNIADNAPVPYPNFINDCGYVTSGLQVGLIQRPITFYWVGCRWTTGDRMIGTYWGTGYDSFNGQNTENTCYDNGGGIWYNSNAGATITSYGGDYSKLHLFRANLTPGLTEVIVDGKPCINQSGGTSPLYGLVLGARRGPAAGHPVSPGDDFSHALGGDLGTLIMIQGTVTAAENTSITNWLNQKYGGLPR